MILREAITSSCRFSEKLGLVFAATGRKGVTAGLPGFSTSGVEGRVEAMEEGREALIEDGREASRLRRAGISGTEYRERWYPGLDAEGASCVAAGAATPARLFYTGKVSV